MFHTRHKKQNKIRSFSEPVYLFLFKLLLLNLSIMMDDFDFFSFQVLLEDCYDALRSPVLLPDAP